eukprot:m.1062243 g.1062243  ORF g.1062243 m.1062243 type:complete len:385 (+) comp24213_c0_seq55:171-1325(+)
MSARSPSKGGSSGAPQYVWERLKNTGIDYKMILSERRLWLLQQDLGRSDILLAEWFALVQELDKVTRNEMGVDQFGTKLITSAEAQERKQRSQSFNRGNDAGVSSDGPNRPRSRSFLEYLSTKSALPDEPEPGKVAAVDLTQATGGTTVCDGADGVQRETPQHLVSGVIASPPRAAKDAATDNDATGGGDDEISHTSDGATPTKKKKISFRKKRKDKSKSSLPASALPSASAHGDGLSADTESSVPNSPIPRSKESHADPEARRSAHDTVGPDADNSLRKTDHVPSHTSRNSTSGAGVKPQTRGTTKKKRKTKTANKALKKMFKVVEKKNSAKGLQLHRNGELGRSMGASASEREDSSATNTDVVTDDGNAVRPSTATVQKMWL